MFRVYNAVCPMTNKTMNKTLSFDINYIFSTNVFNSENIVHFVHHNPSVARSDYSVYNRLGTRNSSNILIQKRSCSALHDPHVVCNRDTA